MDAAWKEFQTALAEGTFTLSDRYHFAYCQAVSKVPCPAGSRSVSCAMFAQKPDFVGEDLWALAQAKAWLGVATPFGTFRLNVNIQDAIQPFSSCDISLWIRNSESGEEKSFVVYRSALNYRSIEDFYASLEDIAADLFQGYPGFPQALCLNRSGAASYLKRRLMLNTCNTLLDTLTPMTASVHALRLSHFKLPTSWVFKGVNHLHVMNTYTSFDPQTLERIQAGDGPVKVYLHNAVSAHAVFNALKYRVVKLAPRALRYAGYNLGWAENEHLRHLGHNLYYQMPNQLSLEKRALGAQAEIFDPLLTLSGRTVAPNESGEKILDVYGLAFEILVAKLFQHGQIAFFEKETVFKTPADKTQMLKLCEQMAQCPPQKRLFVLEDSDSLQSITMDIGSQERYNAPPLEFFAGVPFLNFNGLNAQDSPKANAYLQGLYGGVAEHIFDVVWCGPGGEMLAKFSNLRAQQLEGFYPHFCPFAVSQSLQAKNYFCCILIDICRQQESLVVKA